jgi:hypothetical protein
MKIPYSKREQGLILALSQIAMPMFHLRLEVERDGGVLNAMASQIANDPERLKRIALEALDAINFNDKERDKIIHDSRKIP